MGTSKSSFIYDFNGFDSIEMALNRIPGPLSKALEEEKGSTAWKRTWCCFWTSDFCFLLSIGHWEQGVTNASVINYLLIWTIWGNVADREKESFYDSQPGYDADIGTAFVLQQKNNPVSSLNNQTFHTWSSYALCCIKKSTLECQSSHILVDKRYIPTHECNFFLLLGNPLIKAPPGQE